MKTAITYSGAKAGILSVKLHSLLPNVTKTLMIQSQICILLSIHTTSISPHPEH